MSSKTTAEKSSSMPSSTSAMEWRAEKRWNPFNSNKLLAHVERWKRILRGRAIPAPALITVDPINICNLSCIWCNADYVRNHRNRRLSESMLLQLADFLPRWGRQDFNYFGVDAVCIAGGGEPLLNPATPAFIDRLTANNIETGLVTNGSLMLDCMDSLSQCTWIGVSVDAGSSKTFNHLNGLAESKSTFNDILNNISLLADYSRSHHTRLGSPHPAHGLSYKYLLHPNNIGEVYEATKIAKEIGCKNIHFRPAGTPWDKVGTEEEIKFSDDDIALFNDQIIKAQKLDCRDFNVYGITHKFSEQFERANCFSKCYSLFMTAVISPPSSSTAHEDAFVMSLCCDRRGDPKLELLRDETEVEKIGTAWGGKEHWRLHDSIDIANECPRCTYQPHNQIYEQVILNDSMTYKFI